MTIAIVENAFITGSQAYGDPQPASDVDLVIRVDEATAAHLKRLQDLCFQKGMRFGRLNLICATSDEAFTSWRDGTKILIDRMTAEARTIPRSEAVELFQALRGINYGEEG